MKKYDFTIFFNERIRLFTACGISNIFLKIKFFKKEKTNRYIERYPMKLHSYIFQYYYYRIEQQTEHIKING